MSEDNLLTIEECERLAYKVWYVKFESIADNLLKEHKRYMDMEFSTLKKYKASIYQQFSILKSLGAECDRKMNSIQKDRIKYDEFKKIEKNIKDIERKLTYMMGQPFDKRNLEKEYKTEEIREEENNQDE